MEQLIQLSAMFSSLALITQDNPALCNLFTLRAYQATVEAYILFMGASA